MTTYDVEQILSVFVSQEAQNVITAVLAIIAGIAAIHLGLGFGVWIIHRLEGEKAKREPASYFDEPTEPDYTPVDYVVGIGDDGELVYASEKLKNDEVN